jgi:hypothetical protein
MARKKKIDPEEAALKSRGFYDSSVEEMPAEEQPEGDVKFADDGTKVTFSEGGVIVDLDPQDAQAEVEGKGDEEFDDNLADKMPDAVRDTLGKTLREYVEVDLESRQTWETRMLDGLQIIGLEDIPEDAVAFEGAARVTHPGISEAMVQFNARAMEELMPPEGPVKCGVLGESSQEMEDRAERVEDYMNYQLTDEDDEYYTETDDMLFALPYAGSTFKKVAIDPVLGRTRSRFVSANDFIVPYTAKSLKTAPRYTHRYSMPINTYRRAVAAGYFIDVEFPLGQPQSIGDNPGQRLADKSDDRTESTHSDDQTLQFYEMHLEWEFDWETYGPTAGPDKYGNEQKQKKKFKLPYAVTFEWDTGKVVRIARLWAEDDPTCQKEVWFVHYKFLPGFGFYGLGYLHLIGSLGRAASGALRLLLDGSSTASLQGGFKSKEARMAGQITFTPAEWKDVDMTAEELAKSFYTPPFKEPSPALFKTLEILISGMQRFTSTTEAMVGEASNTGPVGTTVALIEQGSKVFSGIHKRIHAAARREFKLIAYSNFRFMEHEQYPFEVKGQDRQVFREDFSPQIDIAPVSDPNIFSSVQRIALAQAVKQMVDGDQKGAFSPADVKRANQGMLRALRVPDWDQYMKGGDAMRLDPVSENEAILHGIPVKVCREQDDAAHMQLHQQFQQQLLGMDPMIQQQSMPALMAHMAAHYGQAYRKRIDLELQQKTGIPLPPYDPNKPEDNEELPPDVENQIAQAVAKFVAPPPAPQPPPGQDPNAEAQAEAQRKDMLAGREADRQDMLAQRKAQRDDAEKAADLKRKGMISDIPTPPPAAPPQNIAPPGPPPVAQ